VLKRQGSIRGEWGELDGRIFVEEKLCHDTSGRRCEQDAVAIVAGGEVGAGMAGVRAEERKKIRDGGTEAGPGVEDGSCGELRQEASSGCVELSDVLGLDGLVESAVFDGRADDGSSGRVALGARHDVDFGSAEDEVEGKSRWKLYGEHLAFAGSDGEGAEIGCPGSGAVDEGSSVDGPGGGFDGDGVLAGVDVPRGAVRAEVDGEMLDCGEEGMGELMRVEAVFVQRQEVRVLR
jgi:hypothetical protein